MDLIYDFLAENIKKLRNERKISQSNLAEMAGISLRGLQDIEYKKNVPRPATLKKIAKALDVDVSELTKPINVSNVPPSEFLDIMRKKIENAISSGVSDTENLKMSKLENENEKLKKRIESLEIENASLKSDALSFSETAKILKNLNFSIEESIPNTPEQVEAFAALKKMERPNLWKKLLYYSTTRQELLLNVLGLLTELDHARLRKEDVPLQNPLLRKGKTLETSKNRTSHRKK